jgi:hypothetical protein
MDEEKKVKRPRGRPKLDPADRGRRVSIYLARDIDAWLSLQPEGVSKAIARLVREAMRNEQA